MSAASSYPSIAQLGERKTVIGNHLEVASSTLARGIVDWGPAFVFFVAGGIVSIRRLSGFSELPTSMTSSSNLIHGAQTRTQTCTL